MKRISSFLSLIAVLNLVMLGGLAGFIYATGRIDGAKANAVLALLRHPGTPDGLQNQVELILNPPPAAVATAPSTAPATTIEPASATAATAAERIEFARQAVEEQRLKLARDEQELRHRQELLDTRRRDLDARITQFETAKKQFEQTVANTTTKTNDEHFTQALELYNQLKPKQIHDIFSSLPPETVVTYLKAMDAERAGKIIAEFKTEDDKRFISAILEKIRADGTPSATTTSSSPTASSAAP